MPAVLASPTLRRAQVVRCSGARRCVRARAEEGSKVTREYNEASEKVTSAQGSQEGGKTDENGNFFIDERPSQPRSDPMSKEMKEKMRKDYVKLGGSPDQPLPTNYFLNIVIGIGVLAVACYFLGYI